ncbi:type VI secretion system protein VasD [Paraburkholderia lycopersici]|uniref:Type VI secretion system protein VasD n=1 Tax=Paraburkholderia lycopersici TaxID=416944 RepID=A0A1G6XTG3_9BURK|nr:type VI secretion system protein VasD [Paraburkholderia lycopersici]
MSTPKRVVSRLIRFLLVLAILPLSGGCRMIGQKPPAPPPLQVFDVSLSMEKDGNLSAGGVALPLKITMYKLKNTVAFTSANFFELQGNGALASNGEFISEEPFFLRPQQKPVSIRIEKTGDLRFVGFVAEYQQLNGRIWRQIVPLTDAPPVRRSFFSWLFKPPPNTQTTDIEVLATRNGLVSVIKAAKNN